MQKLFSKILKNFPVENQERRKWVPIYPVNVDDYSSRDKTLSRTMIPLRLAWAWTIWKAQGQTIRNKIVLNLGNSEREHGLSYVGFSRATKLSDIGISGGLPGNRITSTISKMIKVKKGLEEDKALNRLEQ